MKFILSLLMVLCVFPLASLAISDHELGTKFSKKFGISPESGREKVEFLFAEITRELQEGRDVHIRRFGTFTVHHRPAQKRINRKTKRESILPAAKFPRFKASDMLRHAVNDSVRK